MKISYEQYLKNELEGAKWALNETNIQYRIYLAEYEKEKLMLKKKIDSIETVLEENKERGGLR